MEISRVSSLQPVNMVMYSGSNNKVNSKNVNNDSFNLSFKGYEKILQQSVNSILKNDIEAERTFTNLMSTLSAKTEIVKTPAFNDMSAAYSRNGFRGLLYELWKSETQPHLKKFLNNETTDLVKDKDGALFQVVHLDTFGFGNNAPNEVKLVFSNPKNKTSIQYGLNKKSELEVWQTGKEQTVYTKFHLETGNRKCVVEQSKYGNPETTYYNKDGSKAFFKNLFRGGVAIVPQ